MIFYIKARRERERHNTEGENSSGRAVCIYIYIHVYKAPFCETGGKSILRGFNRGALEE